MFRYQIFIVPLRVFILSNLNSIPNNSNGIGINLRNRQLEQNYGDHVASHIEFWSTENPSDLRKLVDIGKNFDFLPILGLFEPFSWQAAKLARHQVFKLILSNNFKFFARPHSHFVKLPRVQQELIEQLTFHA